MPKAKTKRVRKKVVSSARARSHSQKHKAKTRRVSRAPAGTRRSERSNGQPPTNLYPYHIERHGDVHWQIDRFRSFAGRIGQDNAASLEKALSFAQERHRMQMRKGGSDYIIHPVRIANILFGEWGIKDADVLAAALLHDVVEDTQTTVKEIKDVFGDSIGRLVDGLTMWKGSETHDAYLRRIAKGSDRLRLIKCADTLDNLRSWHECVGEEREAFPRWWKQAHDLVLPMASRTLRAAARQLDDVLRDPWYQFQAQCNGV